MKIGDLDELKDMSQGCDGIICDEFFLDKCAKKTMVALLNPILLATKNHLSLHRHPETSREMVEETLLILEESQYYSLLELVDAVPRWMFSVPDLLQGF